MLRTATRTTILAAALLAGGTLGTLARPATAADPCRKCGSANCQQSAGHATNQAASHTAAAAEPRQLAVADPQAASATLTANVTATNAAAMNGIGPAAGVPAGYGAYPAAGAGPIHSAIASHYAPNCRPQMYGQPDLFANYYLPPNCGGVGAEIYPAPHYVPPHVGQVYYTYQPLAPHELLYPHHRTYHRYYNGGRGLTRTRVHWYSPPLRAAGDSILDHFRIAR